MPGGRPRTTLKDLPSSWRSDVLAIAAEGASDVEIRNKVGIGKSAWATLMEDSEEFRETIGEARDLCAVWWEANGRRLAVDGGGNASIWIFNMRNRFGWRDNKEEAPKDDMGNIIRDLIAKLPG